MSNMKNMESLWSSIKSYVIMIATCIVLLFMKEHIITILDKVVSWLHLCSEDWFAVIISIIGLVLSVYIFYKIIEKKQQVANSTLALVLFVAIVYTFFRCFDDTYIFWGFDYYKWCDVLYVPIILLIIQKIVCGKKKETEDSSCVHIVDRPIEEPEEDLFYYDWMTQGLLSDLDTVDVRKRSYSVGILGIWGQGKSSFLNLFKYHAIKHGDIVVEFYPRTAKSLKNIQESFFISLKESLKIYHTGIERYISSYARAVAEVDEGWFGKLALALSVLSIDKEKKRINTVIQSIGQRLYVIIEDLDRLTGEEIIEVLKLLERNGDFCNTVFLTAYDKKYVNEVIGKYLQHSQNQDYTDKYFDYEYCLPVNSSTILSNYARKYISDLIVLQEEDKINKQQLLDAFSNNADFIVSKLGTMRHVKRYLNIFLSRYVKVKNDVNASDFMLLTLLRYLDNTTYHAVFELRFLKRGSLYSNNNTKIIFLRKDYLEILNKLNVSDSSKEIIERLFKTEDAFNEMLLKDVYERLEWVDSFDRYFYDFRIGKYHYEDFKQLFKGNDRSAFDSLDKMQKDGVNSQISDFLRSREAGWIENEQQLDRYIKVVIYLDSLERIHDLDYLTDTFLLTTSMKDFVNAKVVKNSETYKETIKGALNDLLEICPVEVAYTCIRINDEIIERNFDSEAIIFSTKEILELSCLAQRSYYKRYPSGEYDINIVLNIAKIREKQGNNIVFAESAKKALVSLMQSYPEQFAKDIVISHPFIASHTKRLISIRFNSSFVFDNMLDVDGFSFNSWIYAFNDTKISYVLKRVYEKGYKNVLQVPALKDKYEIGDFAGLYEAIRANEINGDDKIILDVLKQYISLDYGTIQKLTGIGINRIKESVLRLVNDKKIDKKYIEMKDSITPFEKGDYVKLVDSVYEQYASNLSYSDNIFKIASIIDDGNLKLDDIDVDVPRKDIEAIPVDGKHDRNIYYDPPLITDISNPLPHVDEDEYYMDSLKTDIMSDGKPLRNIVKENNCHYLHEVQHCLRRMNNEDFLFVKKTYKM